MNEQPNGESQLKVAVGLLLYMVNNNNPLVSETVVTSIKKLAEKHPNQILNFCCDFIQKPTITCENHIAAILIIIESICNNQIKEINDKTITSTIDLALNIMIGTSIKCTASQITASGILVSLGRQYYIQVMDTLLIKLEVGEVPHHMIPYTLGTLANINPNSVIHYLKNILTTMIPILGGLRHESLKQSYSYAFGCFCEAMTEYFSNNDQLSPNNNTITVEIFQSEIGMAYDILFNSWLQSREPKVVNSVLNSLASIFPILSVEKINQHTPRIITTLLNLYKKHADSYFVTKCLVAIVNRASNVNGTLLEPLLNNILQILSDILCILPDYANPDLLKSHSEALRCYECFALYFTDSTIDHLIIQLKNNNEKERIKGLLVITHLTSYLSDNSIHRRFKDIMKYVSELLNDPSIKVKKTLMKIIIAFACKGILLTKEIAPEGPEKYIEFILKLCCKQQIKNFEMDNLEFFDLQKSADNALVMLSTSVPELESSFWDLLIKCFLVPYYDEAIVVLLRCLTHLASRKLSNKLSLEQHNEAAFIRCLTLLSVPLPGFRGTFILNFLKNIVPCNNEKYKMIWDTKLPQLSKYLDQNYEIFNQLEWHDLVYDFLTIFLDRLHDEKFNKIFIEIARKHLEIYYNKSNINNMISTNNDGESFLIKQTEKHFLLKCLAIVLTYIQDKNIVIETLENILINFKSFDYQELNCCAEAVGICSRTHLRLVLDKLETIRKEILLKKSSKFSFSFMKDNKHELEIERIRYVLIASYAEICNEASTDKLLRTIEKEILEFVVNELINCKDFSIKRICLKAIGSVADAMHPNRNSLYILMNDRDKILTLISSQIHLHSGPEYIELFPIILPVITSLVRLPLPLEQDQRVKLLKIIFDNIFNASAIYCKINPISQDNYYGDLKLVPFITMSFTKLNQLAQELLIQNLSPATLDEIVTLLELWIKKKKAEQRLPAIETLKILLQTYLDDMKFAYDSPNNFGQTGDLLSKIVPRCTDPNRNIRKIAVECLCLTLCIASRYEGYMRDHDKILFNSIQHIQQQIDSEDPKLLYNLTSDMAHLIYLNLSNIQLIHLIDGLIDSLLDFESSSSSGSSVVLNLTLKNKGADLQNHVVIILNKLIIQLDKIICPRTKSSTLRGILNLATHHSKTVSQILLNQILPFESSICECWAILSTDLTLVLDLLDQFKINIKKTQIFEEQTNDNIKMVNLLPLQTICALHEILKNNQLKDICKQNFSEFFAILLVTTASYIGTTIPAYQNSSNKENKKEKFSIIVNRDALKLNPVRLSAETLKLFLICCEYNEIAKSLEILTKIDIISDYNLFLDTMPNIVDNVYLEAPESVSWIVAALGPYIRADLEPQRLISISFFSHLFKKINDQTVLTENLLEMILDVQNDRSNFVKKISLQGLGFAVEYLNSELIARHCHLILSVLMNTLNYNSISNESDVILEAMLTFSKLITVLEGRKIGSCQVTASVRIKPLLDQDDVKLRRASFHLFGDLAKSLDSNENTEAFKEQVKGNLITLLLHLSESNNDVIKACKYTLRSIGSYLDSPKVNMMIQEHLIDEANLHYSDFIRDLIKVMSLELQDIFILLIMTCLSYLTSPSKEIRSNAALIVGLLYSNLTDDNRSTVNLDIVCVKLMRLLNDEETEVIIRSVQAIGYLFMD